MYEFTTQLTVQPYFMQIERTGLVRENVKNASCFVNISVLLLAAPAYEFKTRFHPLTMYCGRFGSMASYSCSTGFEGMSTFPCKDN